jgi:xylulokinase
VYLPYLLGERTPVWDAEARGAFIGLSARHGRGHLYRAVLEGVAYAFRQIYDMLLPPSDKSARPALVAIDGGARSPLWRSILASAIQASIIEGGMQSGTALGSAFLAALGTGQARSFHDLAQWSQTLGETTPDPEAVPVYDRLYPVFQGLYAKLQPDFHILSQ